MQITVHDQVDPDDAAAVDAGLDAANEQAGPMHEVRRLAAMARRTDGAVVGGAVGRTWGDCCELQQLWVEAAQRHQGLGSRLLQAFEQRGRDRGCRLFMLETFSFQAPAFYRAHGYESVLEIRGYSDGVIKYFMHKRVAG